jgi:hypothetical protein
MRVTSRLYAAFVFFVALGLGVLPSYAGKPGNRSKIPSQDQLRARITAKTQLAQQAAAEFQKTYAHAASTGDAKAMERALHLQAQALKAQDQALRTEAFLESHYNKASGRAKELRDIAAAVKADRKTLRTAGPIPQLAKQELAAAQQAVNKAAPKPKKMSWKEARQQFQLGLKGKDFAHAREALQQMEAAAGGGLTLATLSARPRQKGPAGGEPQALQEDARRRAQRQARLQYRAELAAADGARRRDGRQSDLEALQARQARLEQAPHPQCRGKEDAPGRARRRDRRL